MNDFQQSRNKELTMQKFIEAVGEILADEGVEGLGVNHIARKAGYDKSLIKRYFGSRDDLLDAFITENDYWLKSKKEILRSINEVNDVKEIPAAISNVFKNQLTYFYQNKYAQLIILAEIKGEEKELLQSIARAREAVGEDIFEKIEPMFIKAGIKIRNVMALLTCGIYYLVLHAIKNGSTICGGDINTKEGRESLAEEIDWLVNLIFGATGLF